MNFLRSLCLLGPLLWGLETMAEDKIFFLRNTSKEKRIQLVEEYYYKALETEHYFKVKNFQKLHEECNPPDVEDYSSSVTICHDSTHFVLWTGMGSFTQKTDDNLGHALTLSGTAYFFGGQLIFVPDFRSLFIMEGKVSYLPSLEEESVSSVENFEAASILTADAVYQRRFFGSSFSYRLGAQGGRIPVPKDLTGTNLVSSVEVNNRPMTFMGPLLGLKYFPNSGKGGKYSLYLDAVQVVNQDGKSGSMFQDFFVRARYQWFLHRYWAVTLDGESYRVSTRDNFDVSGLSFSVGIKLYAF